MTRPMQRCLLAISVATLLLPPAVFGQTVYHLHTEVSTTAGARQLKVAGPDAAAATFQSADYKNQPPTAVSVIAFDTQAGVPSTPGTIATGSTVSFSIWMRKTANFGTFYPRVWLYLNNYDFNGLGGTPLCLATSASALTTTLVKYTVTCATSTALSMTSTDRWFLGVGFNMTAGPGNKSVKVEVKFEGVLNGNYDSTVTSPPVVPPPPRITGLSPVVGPVGTSVTVTGQNFGATQGASTIKFNTTAATVTNWTTTAITATVPPTVTTSSIVVTVAGQSSNSLTFSVSTVGSVTGTVTRVGGSIPIAGATVQLLQAGVVKASVTTNGAGSYTTGSLPGGFYDTQVSASGYITEVAAGLVVGGGGSTTSNMSLKMPGTVTGQVTQQGGGAVPGAGISASIGSAVLASATANASGNFTLTLKPGTYALEASAPGYTPTLQTGTVVSEGGTTPLNLTISAVAATSISYTYDELGRLVGVTDATGDTARYVYDAVGNVLNIARQSTSLVNVLEFTPNSGPVGTTVTITGTGFSATPSQNSVTFNGVSTGVSAASSSQLTVNVPPSASTGVISVTSPSGSANSASAFTVGASGGPTITNFTPTVASPGAPFTVSGSNFQTTPSSNSLTLNTAAAIVASSTTTSLSSTVPASAQSGRVRVVTPYGVATSAATLFVVPSPYLPADVASTLVVPFDVPTTVLTPPNKISILAIEGSANHRISVQVLNNSASCAIEGKLYGTAQDPWDYRAGIAAMTEPATFFQSGVATFVYEARVLFYAGQYQLVLDGCNTATNSVTVTVTDVLPDLVSPIVPSGAPVVSNITSIGQNARLTFAGTAGQRVSFNLATNGAGSCFAVRAYFLDPYNQLPGSNLSAPCVGFTDPFVLPATTIYTILVAPEGLNTATFTSTLYDVPPDPSASTAINGSAVALTTTVPGQNGAVTFDATASQSVTLHGTNSSFGGCTIIELIAPGGSVLSNTGQCGAAFNLGPFTLPATGTYTIRVDPSAARIGSITIGVTNP